MDWPHAVATAPTSMHITPDLILSGLRANTRLAPTSRATMPITLIMISATNQTTANTGDTFIVLLPPGFLKDKKTKELRPRKRR